MQVRDGDDAQQEEPEWKMRGRKVYKRLFGWWERGVPPTWLVIVGCLVVQVGVVILISANFCIDFQSPTTIAWIWSVSSCGEGVCGQGESKSSHLQLLQVCKQLL